MIDIVSTQDLRHLAEADGEWCVSVYLPTHVAGAETGQDPIRFKNLLARAAHHLLAVGASIHETDDLLSAASALLDDVAFWAHAGQGLAVFVTGEGTRTYRVPDPVEELVVVADRLHVTPLLPSVASGYHFHVLAIGQNRVRLLYGSRYTIEELAVDEIAEIPASLVEALRLDEREPQLQSHGAVRTGAGRMAPRFHGQGTGRIGQDSDVDRFLHAVDAGVCELVGDDGTPLVLAGVERIVARYRELTHHPRVVDRGIMGSPERLRPDELRDRAWPLVKPCFDAEQRAAQGRILDHADRAVTTVAAALIAARDGRIASLFVPVGVHRWGRVDPDRRAIEPSEEQQPGDRDLLDVVAVDTLLTGGSVFAVDRRDVPGDGPLAAELRY